MSSEKRITDAKTTCDGLHRLVRKLNVAAVDLDKSGGSAYDLIALLASTRTCVSSLSVQLDALAAEPPSRHSATAESTTSSSDTLSCLDLDSATTAAPPSTHDSEVDADEPIEHFSAQG